jgi:hypothetical protein
MTGPPTAADPTGAERDARSRAVVAALIGTGLLADDQRERAESVADPVLSRQAPRDRGVPTRRRLLEVAG